MFVRRSLWNRWFLLLALAGSALAVLLMRELLPPGTSGIPGTDAVLLFTWEQYTRAALAQHHLPYWNPYQFGGVPFLADTQTTVLYPPAMLLRWIPAPAYLSWLAALHMVIAGAGGAALARTLGLGWAAAAAAGVALMFGGSIAPWLYHGHLLLLFLASWLPWALSAAIWSARRATVWPHPALVVILVLQFLAGYVQGSIYLVTAVALYVFYTVVVSDPDADAGTRRWHPPVQLVVAGALALALSAFELLPLIRLVGEAGRTAGLSFLDAVHEGWTLRDLPTIFFPVTGLPPGDFYHDMPDRLYVGWLLAALAPFAFADRRRLRINLFLLLLVAAGLCFALATELPFYRLHYRLFPGLREPGRVLMLSTVGLAVLGATGVQRVVELARARRWRTIAMPLLASACLVATAYVYARAGQAIDGRLVHASWIPAASAAALVAAIALAWSGSPGPAAALLSAIAAADIYSFTAGSVHPVNLEDGRTIREWLGPPVADRMWSRCQNRIDRPELMLNRQPALSGAGGVFLRPFDEWTSLLAGGDQSWSAEPPVLGGRRDLLDQASVARVVSCDEVTAPGLSLASRLGPVLVYRNERAWPRAVWFCDVEFQSHDEAIARLIQSRYDAQRRLVRPHVANVRWAAALSDAEREALERRFGLAGGSHERDRTWRYALEDASTHNLIALIQDPAVEDTQGIDRGTGAVIDPPLAAAPAGGTDALVGTVPCDQEGSVVVGTVNTADARAVADVTAPVAGVVFFSETFYSERRAFVDGRPAQALRANLAFTAVRVPAGRHRVELRYVPAAFYTGSACTAAALVAWPLLAWGTRRRRRPLRAGSGPGKL